MPKIESLTHLGLGRADTGELLPRTLPGEEIEIGTDGLPRILVTVEPSGYGELQDATPDNVTRLRELRRGDRPTAANERLETTSNRGADEGFF